MTFSPTLINPLQKGRASLPSMNLQLRKMKRLKKGRNQRKLLNPLRASFRCPSLLSSDLVLIALLVPYQKRLINEKMCGTLLLSSLNSSSGSNVLYSWSNQKHKQTKTCLNSCEMSGMPMAIESETKTMTQERFRSQRDTLKRWYLPML